MKTVFRFPIFLGPILFLVACSGASVSNNYVPPDAESDHIAVPRVPANSSTDSSADAGAVDQHHPAQKPPAESPGPLDLMHR